MTRALVAVVLVGFTTWAAEPKANPPAKAAPPAGELGLDLSEELAPLVKKPKPEEPAPAAAPAPVAAPEQAAEPAAEPEATPTQPTPAVAAVEEAPVKRPPALEIALKLGGHFPQLVSKLKTTFDLGLSVGYAPLLDQQLQFFAGLNYSQPTHRISSSDPRLGAAGADYTSNLVLRDLALSLGAKYFIFPPDRFLVPYAGLGLRVHFLGALVEGNGGSDFGKYSETDTRYGLLLFGGVGVHLVGPGMVLAELAIDYSPIGQVVTGPANVGSISLVVGYGLQLF